VERGLDGLLQGFDLERLLQRRIIAILFRQAFGAITVANTKGRLRSATASATGEMILPFTLTSRMARSNLADCASLIAWSMSPASAAMT